MTYNFQTYGKLLAATLPSVITEAEEYNRIEAIFNSYMDKGEDKLSPEETRLFELLANLLEAYESRTLKPLNSVSPADTLRFIMEENHLKQTDLEDVFGSQAVVSKVLNHKRQISKAQAKRLADRFRLSVEAFI
jgi:Predicted transcription regulator containing HTH domain